VHPGLSAKRIAARTAVLTAAYAAHPERFPRGAPKPQALPNAVWINDPARLSTSQEDAQSSHELTASSTLACSGLVASGHETVAKTLGNSPRSLHTHRERWQQLTDEPALIPNAIKESLRLYATVEVLTRRWPGLCRLPDQALRYVPSGVLRRLKNL